MKVQLLLAHLSKKQAAILTSCSLLIALGLELKMIHLRHAVGMPFSAGIGKLVRVDGKIDGGPDYNLTIWKFFLGKLAGRHLALKSKKSQIVGKKTHQWICRRNDG
ncbi:hypothetical protein ATANTOWER_004596 [Ataeniobius toweri]|uniref:Uncharacterized protein n=1 Tax=Ataeniobius toweri TaxID=208326 RepID=A0ABU7CBZ1_9TELE|nr:hypothetical protein [Ataeniobius toweri]